MRLLFLADTHLGIDLPANPRIQRRRRGDDFMSNYLAALEYARRTNCDAVLHGGDVFFRSKIRPELVQAAFAPLRQLANEGLPIFIVPGNHERSRIPHPLLAEHPGIHIFNRPRTFGSTLRGIRIAFIGFPYARSIRHEFPSLLRKTAWESTPADVRLLCVHHCFEAATVGPGNFIFRRGDDVIRHADVPVALDAVLSGHIHRHQILTRGLNGETLRTPVVYPGSIERTSFAERGEPKGFLVVNVQSETTSGYAVTHSFHPLPARPMVVETMRTDCDAATLRTALSRVLHKVPRDAILRLMVQGSLSGPAAQLLSAANLRAMAAATMTVEVRPMGPR